MCLSRLALHSRNKVHSSNAVALVKSILGACSEYSSASGLTGGLVFNERFFLQVMEGAREQISRQLKLLMLDERQDDLTLIGMETIPRRIFDGWAVGYAARSPLAEPIYLRYGILAELDPTRIGYEGAVDLVREFSAIEAPFVQRASASPPNRPATAEATRIKVTNTLAGAT